MNALPGIIKAISVQGQFALMDVDVDGTMLKCIMIESPDSNFLAVGKSVQVLFKETEVVIGHAGTHGISLQNKISCRIDTMDTGNLLCRLSLHFEKHKIVSVVTRSAVEQLRLREGDEVLAMIKTNEVLLSE
ncbi:MAG: TOBE domain-containing protein [Saprospiraceae bacterium]|nr:TOBE domain-containing protein [Saprospiraceae bacterium]